MARYKGQSKGTGMGIVNEFLQWVLLICLLTIVLIDDARRK